MTALKDPEVKAVWAIRGGRLSCELWDELDRLPLEKIAALPKKPILGFSNITSLHLWFNERGFSTIHSLVPINNSESPNAKVNKLTSLEPSINILKGKMPITEYTGFESLNFKVYNDSNFLIRAPIRGGTLSSMHYYHSTYGNVSEPSIWIIETIDDATRIESILYALKRSGFFDNACAIIFGNLHGKSESEAKEKGMMEEYQALEQRYKKVVEKFALSTKAPVFISNGKMQFGHGDYNHPIPLGTSAEFSIVSNPKESILKITAS